MRYDANHRERTRKQLVTEASEAIRRDGPDRVSVAAIMGHVGLTHGGFYAHFKSKDDLIATAIDEMFDQTSQSFAKRTANRPPAEALAKYIDSYLSKTHVEQVQTGCPLPAMAGDVARLGPKARKRFAAGAERQCHNSARLFREIGYGDEEAVNLASSLMAEMSGAIAIARAVHTPAQAKAICERSRLVIKRRLGLTASM